MTLIINLFGGPGTGKSTIMADLFSRLKWDGYNVEMAPEFAKEKVWEESFGTIENQIYVFGKQHHIIHRLKGKVDVIITDSPLLLSLYYGPVNEHLDQLVLWENSKNKNINIFLNRKKKYVESGRMQTENEAKKIDNELRDLLESAFLEYKEFDAIKHNVDHIYEYITDKIENEFLAK